jgi:hypothetical protein
LPAEAGDREPFAFRSAGFPHRQAGVSPAFLNSLSHLPLVLHLHKAVIPNPAAQFADGMRDLLFRLI